jgi:hypothetical protein
MALINKPYTFTNGAGNAADGTQVNADFDTIYSLVNGNLEGVNMKDATITLAKLASEVKVIESVTHTGITSDVTLTAFVETQILSQNITLSGQRYCLIMANLLGYSYDNDACPLIRIYDGTTILLDGTVAGAATVSHYFQKSVYTFKQLASGAHTIYLKVFTFGATNGVVYGGTGDTQTHLTTIVFAF